MESLGHFLFELIKITILGFIYATILYYIYNLIPENKLYNVAGVLEYIASLYTRDYLNEKNEDIWIEFRATADLPDDYSEWITELNKSEIMLTYNNTENNDEETKEDNQ